MPTALQELETRAQKGLPACQIELASCFLRGVDPSGSPISKNFRQAKHWLEAAHASGAHTASTMLGELYEHGNGVEIDISRSIGLYEQASERGSYLSCLYLARIYAAGKGVAQSREKASTWYEKTLDYEDEVDDEAGLQEAKRYLGDAG